MRALVLLLLAGCAFDSHSIPDDIDPVETGPDAGPAAAPDAAPPTQDADAEVERLGFGDPCTTGDQCEGGICADMGGTWLCSQPCTNDNDCPDHRNCADETYCEMGWDDPGGGGGG